MANYTITLTTAQADALVVILNTTLIDLESELQSYLVNIAEVHIEQSLDSIFKAKTKVEKETLLG